MILEHSKPKHKKENSSNIADTVGTEIYLLLLYLFVIILCKLQFQNNYIVTELIHDMNKLKMLSLYTKLTNLVITNYLETFEITIYKFLILSRLLI